VESFEMDAEEDPFVTLEKMLANRGKKRSPVGRSSKGQVEEKKKAVSQVIAESEEKAAAGEVANAGEEAGDSESSGNIYMYIIISSLSKTLNIK
jgi:hypothetical protein